MDGFTADLLDAAADLVDRVGLLRGAWWPGMNNGRPHRDGDPVCVLGALAVARIEVCGLSGLATPRPSLASVDASALAAVRAVVGDRAVGYFDSAAVAEWSDRLRVARRRRAVRVLRRAAARCRRG